MEPKSPPCSYGGVILAGLPPEGKEAGGASYSAVISIVSVTLGSNDLCW
jgi:hypothetical protein